MGLSNANVPFDRISGKISDFQGAKNVYIFEHDQIFDERSELKSL